MVIVLIVSNLLLVYNLEKNIFMPDEGPTQGLNDAKLTTEANYPIIFKIRKKICVESAL